MIISFDFLAKKFSKKIIFLEVSQIDTFLYSFYSEFYADSESVTFFRFTSIFWEISTVKVWPKSQKCRFLGKIRHGYGLFWYQSIDSDQGYSGPLCPTPSPGRSVLLRAGNGSVILCIYRWCRLVPISRRDRRNCCIAVE